MKNIVLLLNLAAAALVALLIAGCGSSGQSVPLERHLSVTDSLQREISGAKSQNASLTSRIASLESDKRLQLTRIAELESSVTFLKAQIAKIPPPAPPPVADPRLAYQHALELFRSKQYSQAALEFQSLLDGGIELKLQDNCRYWLGECAFGSKEYAKAIEQFRQVFAYEKSEKKDESQLMIARSCLKMGKPEQAKIEYQKLIDTFPATPYLKQAKEQLAKLK